MAKRGAKAAATILLGAGVLAAAGRLSAEPVIASVTLRVRDYQKLPSGQLLAAQKLATGVYDRAGVRLVWRGHTPEAAGGYVFDVVILSAEMTELMKPDPGACGRASHETRRAYIFYPCIVDHVDRHGGITVTALALVLAHEVGHLLLPANSHARSGLMQAKVKGRILLIPDLTPKQGETIRARLTSALVGEN